MGVTGKYDWFIRLDCIDYFEAVNFNGYADGSAYIHTMCCFKTPYMLQDPISFLCLFDFSNFLLMYFSFSLKRIE